MGTYRNKLDMIAAILNVSNHAKKTQIMYGANLSFKGLEKYLAKVLEAALITFEEEKQGYMLTAKGQEFLAIYHEYAKKIKLLEKRLMVVQTMEKALNELCSIK